MIERIRGEMRCSVSPGQPADEVCNGQDDDCDGAVDDGLCCEPAVEVCNGVDDDCNGSVDDGLGGGPCSVGVGACLSFGQQRCRGGQMECSARPGEPSPEACDNVDNDCDGARDEGSVVRCCERVGPVVNSFEAACAGGDPAGSCRAASPRAYLCP